MIYNVVSFVLCRLIVNILFILCVGKSVENVDNSLKSSGCAAIIFLEIVTNKVYNEYISNKLNKKTAEKARSAGKFS